MLWLKDEIFGKSFYILLFLSLSFDHWILLSVVTIRYNSIGVNLIYMHKMTNIVAFEFRILFHINLLIEQWRSPFLTFYILLIVVNCLTLTNEKKTLKMINTYYDNVFWYAELGFLTKSNQGILLAKHRFIKYSKQILLYEWCVNIRNI